MRKQGNGTGQREKFNGDTFVAVTSLVPSGTSVGGWIFQLPKQRQGGWASVSPMSVLHGLSETFMRQLTSVREISRKGSAVSPPPPTHTCSGG